MHLTWGGRASSAIPHSQSMAVCFLSTHLLGSSCLYCCDHISHKSPLPHLLSTLHMAELLSLMTAQKCQVLTSSSESHWEHILFGHVEHDGSRHMVLYTPCPLV